MADLAEERQGDGQAEACPSHGHVPGSDGHERAEPDSGDGGGSEEFLASGHSEAEQRQLFSGALAGDYYQAHGVKHRAQFLRNDRAMRLFSHVWTPAQGQPRALICCCHGYGNDTSWMFQLNCVRFAADGYAVCALDYEGHGLSDGLRCAFRSVDVIARDCIAFFDSVHSQFEAEFEDIPCFLFGESMGGAVALLIENMCKSSDGGSGAAAGAEADGLASRPLQWQGCILMSPMLRIKEEMRPHWLLDTLLRGLVHIIPDAAIVPTPDTIMMSCKDPDRLKLALGNPRRYAGKPRLGSAVELLRVTEKMAELIPRVTLPLAIFHGEADVVTDCFSSRELFKSAASRDKTLKLYPGGGHQLLQGEALQLREQVWKDLLSWLEHQVPSQQ